MNIIQRIAAAIFAPAPHPQPTKAVDSPSDQAYMRERGLMPATPRSLLEPARVSVPRPATVDGHQLTGERYRAAKKQLMSGEHLVDLSGVRWINGETIDVWMHRNVNVDPGTFDVRNGQIVNAHVGKNLDGS